MQQQVEQVVAGGTVSIEDPIEKKCGVEQRPDHVIKVTDKRVPPVEMRVYENRIEVVVLKGAAKGTGISSRGKRDENGIDEQGSNREAIHAIVILQRAVTV